MKLREPSNNRTEGKVVLREEDHYRIVIDEDLIDEEVAGYRSLWIET